MTDSHELLELGVSIYVCIARCWWQHSRGVEERHVQGQIHRGQAPKTRDSELRVGKEWKLDRLLVACCIYIYKHIHIVFVKPMCTAAAASAAASAAADASTAVALGRRIVFPSCSLLIDFCFVFKKRPPFQAGPFLR